ncbi:Ubiquitin thioesterase otulin [Armadillidium nasatum]|uniref:Ubiquitin thioesterase otulin n=1 Tax=Armadillidium nasatum TaxID=96803 RepID=A0A5N5TFP5_9CRUS|nr:Ubiquitin thioesterase otulin [Armadillidium nasatum]
MSGFPDSVLQLYSLNRGELSSVYKRSGVFCSVDVTVDVTSGLLAFSGIFCSRKFNSVPPNDWGKYFGPESPVEHNPQLNFLEQKIPLKAKSPEVTSTVTSTEQNTPERLYTDDNSPLLSEYSCKTESGKPDIVDTSTAYLADDDDGSGTSEFEESLPLDSVSHSSLRETKRLKKRLRNQRLERSQESASGKNLSNGKLPASISEPNCLLLTKKSSSNFLKSFETENSSSETSPRDRKGNGIRNVGHSSRLSFYQNSRGRELNKCNKENPYFYANFNSDDEWGIDERDEAEKVENDEKPSVRKRSLSRDLSLADLVGRLRKRSSFRSLSRDNSVSSRMSDFLRRDDSICSNLSDFAFSECSEISLDIKDESIADQTITSLADIEDELNTLKSSVIEMDEEFLRFASRPNPYLLRTTYTDYSLDSGESRPESSLDNYRKFRSRSSSIANEGDNDQNVFLSTSATSEGKNASTLGDSRSFSDGTHKISDPESLDHFHPDEVDTFQKDWTPSKKIKISRHNPNNETSKKTTSLDDAFPSLEWDNGCFKQYEDDIKRREAESQYKVGEHHLDRHKFLPDHSSLELDLEKELQSSEDLHPTFSGRDILSSTLSPCVSPPSSVLPHGNETLLQQSVKVQEKQQTLSKKRQPPTSLPLRPSSEMLCNQMTASIDSAIQSAPGSRSGSSSPISHLTQSMMSSGICASWTEALESSDNLKDQKFLNIEESGYGEGETDLQSSGGTLESAKVVREVKNQSEIEENNFQYLNQVHEDEPCQETPELNANNSTVNNNNNCRSNGNSNNSSYSNNNSNNNTNTFIGNNSIMGHSYSSDSANHSLSDLSTSPSYPAGYAAIPNELNLCNLRRIRGDNYCGIRAVLFQVLVSGIPIPNSYQVYNRLLSEVHRGALWLNDYTFGKRLFYSKSKVVEGFKDCLETLDKFVLDSAESNSTEETVVSRLNSDPLLDIRLCEAAKLHMLASALDLYKMETEGLHVPLFGMIMFARQSCLNPKDFMINHLNSVGDSAGLEQIEMFLLGYALKVTLQVVRPSSFGGEDFVCFYPDENIGIWPDVTLVAEDDRHYNVLVK